MRIDEYRFGSITVDGSHYQKDVILLRGAVLSPWWRSAGGHVFAPADLQAVLDAAPEIVILGTGYFGLVTVLDETLAVLGGRGIEPRVDRTGKQIAVFNTLAAAGRDVAAALHLTC